MCPVCAGRPALSEEQVTAEMATLVVAGYETTANTLTLMLFALHAHSAQAAALRRELAAAGKGRGRDTGGG